jgi:hypothetical protein
MRRGVGLVVVLLALALVAGCGGSETLEASKPFCRAADEYDNEIQRQQKDGEVDVDRQITRVEVIARTAPAAIADDAQMFLDALRDVDDDPSLRDDPKIREAVEDVNRYANQACGVYDRRSGI